MHYTLLPDSAHAAIHREYRTRAAIVFCFVMAIVCVIGIVSLFPAYIFSVTKEKSQRDIVDSINASASKNLASMKSELSRDAGILAIVDQYTGGPQLSDIVSDVVGVKGSVTYSSLAINHDDPKTVSIVIQGVAPTRTSLLDLEKRLESMKTGNTVELPLQELKESTSIHFSLKVTEHLP